eukprot:168196_1
MTTATLIPYPTLDKSATIFLLFDIISLILLLMDKITLNPLIKKVLVWMNITFISYLFPQLFIKFPILTTIPWITEMNEFHCDRIMFLSITLLCFSILMLFQCVIDMIPRSEYSKRWIYYSTYCFWFIQYIIVIFAMEGEMVNISNINTKHCLNAYTIESFAVCIGHWECLVILNGICIWYMGQNYEYKFDTKSKIIIIFLLIAESINSIIMSVTYQTYRTEIIPAVGYTIKLIIYAIIYHPYRETNIENNRYRFSICRIPFYKNRTEYMATYEPSMSGSRSSISSFAYSHKQNSVSQDITDGIVELPVIYGENEDVEIVALSEDQSGVTNELMNEINKLKQNAVTLEAIISAQDKQLKSQQEEMNKFEKTILDKDKIILYCENDIKNMKEKLNEFEQIINNLNADHDIIISDKNDEINEMNEEINTKDDEISTKDDEIEQLKIELENRTQQLMDENHKLAQQIADNINIEKMEIVSEENIIRDENNEKKDELMFDETYSFTFTTRPIGITFEH